MLLLLSAFIAGILTVLAPCVLPLLPVIIGGSVSGNTNDKRRPLLITVSLAVSLFLFTLLLKTTTLFINIPPRALSIFSGVIIITLGLVTLFPKVYATIMLKFGIEQKSQELLAEGAKNKNEVLGPILTGAALGPVFSSCSPVYAYILATVLPASFGQAIVYMIAYIIGLALVLLLISSYGQRLIRKLKFVAKPNGWFQRSLAIIFLIVGLGVATGYDKKFQVYVSEHTIFKFDALSASLIPKNGNQPVAVANSNLNVVAQKAPEFTGLGAWINSDPLTLASLKGKVVLVDFWTYSCINCIRNNPYLEKWYETYKDQGLVVIGIHAPEFSFEKVLANVQQGVKDQGITYPVALDNDLSTWNTFHNQYWPASYLIDADGNLRRVHYGEGEYSESEDAIRALLKEKGAAVGNATTTGKEVVPVSQGQTSETYLGKLRASNYVGTPALGSVTTSAFSAPNSAVDSGSWYLTGNWEIQSEKIIARGSSMLTFHINAKQTYLVMGSASAQKVRVLVDGLQVTPENAGSDVHDGYVGVGEARLYRLTAFPTQRDYTLTLEVPNGVELNAFTFGG
jgi:cytochrome c biogenesis protein CcdA/thiol-disulfide isomerase/thioredoxin